MACSLPSSKTWKSFAVQAVHGLVFLIGDHRVHQHQSRFGLELEVARALRTNPTVCAAQRQTQEQQQALERW
jgi:hypothetical protein